MIRCLLFSHRWLVWRIQHVGSRGVWTEGARRDMLAWLLSLAILLGVSLAWIGMMAWLWRMMRLE